MPSVPTLIWHHQEEQEETKAAQKKAVNRGESVEKVNVSSPSGKCPPLAKPLFLASLQTIDCFFPFQAQRYIFQSLLHDRSSLYDHSQTSVL